MKIVLINPPHSSRVERHWSGYAPLGLGYLAAVLLANEFDVSVIDGKLSALTPAEILQEVSGLSPTLVGITAMTMEFPMASEIAHGIKRHDNIPVILGGPHANAAGSSALAECPAIDYCCVGEGEDLILELLAGMGGDAPLDGIRGLMHRRGGEIVVNPPRPYRGDCDALPFPAWSIFPPVPMLPILTQRGCPFKCVFCSHNSGVTVRYRSIDNTLAELRHIAERYKPDLVRFEDETFGYRLERTKEILRGIINERLHTRMSFSAQTRVDRVDSEFFRLLKEANFETVELGVESRSDAVLERIGKGITVDQVTKAVALARRAGLKVWCKFILGHPHESLHEIGKTVKLISRLNPDRLSVSIMTPYPGTPIYDMAVSGKAGYRLLSTDWKTFDKYVGDVMELDKVSLTRLKCLQIWCYLRLYLSNYRFLDLLTLVVRHHAVVTALVKGLLVRLITGRASARST